MDCVKLTVLWNICFIFLNATHNRIIIDSFRWVVASDNKGNVFEVAEVISAISFCLVHEERIKIINKNRAGLLLSLFY